MALLANKHQNIKPFNVNDLRGGINLYSPADMLADNEARNLENFEFNPNTDQLVTRGGLSAPLFSFQYDIKSVYYDYEMNIYLVFIANKNVYKYVINEQPELLGSLLGSNRPVCCKFGNNVYIASGEKVIGLLTDLIKSYQGLKTAVEMRDPQLYLYYSDEIDKLEAQKFTIMTDYSNKETSKKNFAKILLAE